MNGATCGGPCICDACIREAATRRAPGDALRITLDRVDDKLAEAGRWLQEMFDNPGGQSGPRAHAMARVEEARVLLDSLKVLL